MIPGEVCRSADGLVLPGGGMMGLQKSAEGVVAIAHDGEGLNVQGGKGAGTSMGEGDADRKAEKPEASRRVARAEPARAREGSVNRPRWVRRTPDRRRLSTLYEPGTNRRMPNGTYGGVRGGGS